MIVKLKGKIESFSQLSVDLDVQDVVYRILMTPMNIEELKHKREDIEIFIYEILKEDSRILVGFKNDEEREIFSDLLSVQGVGSKMALNIMSDLDNQQIVNTIKNEELQTLTKITGVGQKLAKRIFNELKEKIQKKFELNDLPITETNLVVKADLVSCLVNLGYPQRISEETAIQVIMKNEEKDLEEMIPIALKLLTKPV